MKNVHESKVLIGELVTNLVHISPLTRSVTSSRQLNIVYAGDAVIPARSIFSITSLYNGFVFLHEHAVQAADWQVLKRMGLVVVQSESSEALGQTLELTGVAVRSILTRLPYEEQTALYRWFSIRQERGHLKKPVRHTVAH